MDAVDVARWQFAITTVYHFLFVPITIGMSLMVDLPRSGCALATPSTCD